MNYSGQGFGSLPVVVKNIIIITAIVFVVTSFLHFGNIDFYELLSLHYFKSDLFRPHQLVTYLFMHGGFMHILMNMFAVFMFGRVLEMVWGPKRFLTFYLITGIGAALIHMGYTAWEFHRIDQDMNAFMASPDPDQFLNILKHHFEGMYDYEKAMVVYDHWSANPGDPSIAQEAASGLNNIYQLKADIPTVGASGSVFGLLLAFGMLFPETELMMLFLPVPIKAKYFVLIYAGIELFLGIRNNPGDNVAHFAHLGGALFGFILVKLWNRDRKNFY
jgi:membrane associated rhomboid family serine protease